MAPSRLIGREQEIAELLCWFSDAPPQRMVTLTGPGGGGKTRLARAVSDGLAGRFADGVVFVDLAAVAAPVRVVDAVAHALDLRAQVPADRDEGSALLDAIGARLARRRILLVLDNCEHLLAPCAALADALLRRCPDQRILATSREPLGINGERAWPVPPLGLPPASGSPTVAAVLAADAAQLFVARARAVAPDFAVTSRNAAALARICRRLEGLPLALELVAARAATLTVEQIAARLDRLFALAADGPPTAPARQRTLHAALDWSHDLLDDAGRALLRRLAAFAGGWTLEAAEAVCTDDALAADRVLDALDGLVPRSLVVPAPGAGGANRYRLLEPIHQFAAERLAAGGEEDAVRRRHAGWYLARSERVEAPLDGGPAVRAWLAELDREFANIRSALEWARQRDPGTHARLAAATFPFFFVRGDHVAGREGGCCSASACWNSSTTCQRH